MLQKKKKRAKLKVGAKVRLIPEVRKKWDMDLPDKIYTICRVWKNNIDNKGVEYPYAIQDCPLNVTEDQVIREEIYNSPLYKILQED